MVGITLLVDLWRKNQQSFNKAYTNPSSWLFSTSATAASISAGASFASNDFFGYHLSPFFLYTWILSKCNINVQHFMLIMVVLSWINEFFNLLLWYSVVLLCMNAWFCNQKRMHDFMIKISCGWNTLDYAQSTH